MAAWKSAVLAVCLWFAIIGSYSCAKHRFKRTYNVDPSFSIWPNKSQILYYLDTAYSDSERNLIKAGITQIMSNLQGCVSFVETTASDTNFKIKVTPFDVNGTMQTFCWSYQGQMNMLRNTGAPEQPLVITRGPNGCLDGSLHNIMKYFAIVLGKRNEHQRGDRDKYITVNQQNIIVENSYRLYNTSEAVWTLFPYDFCSITHNKMTDYAAPGTLAFTPVSGPQAVPFLNTISYYDCRIISMEYSCPAAACKPLDCNQARLDAANNAGGLTTPMSGGLSSAAPGWTNGPGGSTMAPGSGASTQAPGSGGATPAPGSGGSTLAPGSGASTPSSGGQTPSPGSASQATAGPGSGTTVSSGSATSQATMAPGGGTAGTQAPVTAGPSPTAATPSAPGATTASPGAPTMAPGVTTAAPGATPAPGATTAVPGVTTASAGGTTVAGPTAATPATSANTGSTATSGTGSTSAAITGSTVAITSTTTQMSTTTPECPADWFCKNPPDESSYLYGPYMPNPTLLLTRGKCIMEYNMNYGTGKFDPLNTPELITSYFPGPGGPTAPFPLSMNYMTPDPDTNNATYVLNMIGPWSQKALSCSVNPAKPPATATTCAEAADAKDINVADITGRYSSATSQYSWTDGHIYQYVVNKPSRTEIGLVNTDFSESYQNTTGFLKGQNKIYQMTALQILNDPDGIDPPVMAVFGIGTDGSTGYVGFAQLPLSADPDQPLSPVTWIVPPVPMKDAFSSGC